MALFHKEVQAGEWFEIGAKLTDGTAATRGVPLDVTGKAVALTVRTGASATDTEVPVAGETGLVVDGPGGVVSVGGRIATVGRYVGTVTVGAASDGPGWPVKERLTIEVTDCP
jgi:hypothetical protein